MGVDRGKDESAVLLLLLLGKLEPMGSGSLHEDIAKTCSSSWGFWPGKKEDILLSVPNAKSREAKSQELGHPF